MAEDIASRESVVRATGAQLERMSAEIRNLMAKHEDMKHINDFLARHEKEIDADDKLEAALWRRLIAGGLFK